MGSKKHRSLARGFTLIETIVALVILGFLLVAAFQVSATGLEIAGRSDALRASALHARSVIDQLASMGQGGEGEFSGEFPDGARWEGTMKPYESAWNDQLDNLPVELYEIAVTVTSARGQQISLKTLRMSR